MTRFHTLLSIILVPASACTPFWPEIQECPDTGVCATEASTTTDSTSSGVATDEPTGFHTVTSGQATEPDTSTSTTGSSTTEAPDRMPPVIDDLLLDPDFLGSAGSITVTVKVAGEGAESVSIDVDGGDPFALTPAGDGILFTGEITVFGESWNGDHQVTARATRQGKVSEAKQATFSVAAPKAGSEVWLKKGSELIPSYGAAVAVDEAGEVIELITRPTPQGQECHLRRRDGSGTPVWGGDTRWLAPGEDCVGEDLKLAPDGTIYALVNVYTDTFGSFQLHHLDKDGVPLGPVSELGSLGHLGRGLDVNDAGDVLLCGTKPAVTGLDAWTRLIPAAGVPWTKAWDYLNPKEPKPNKFDERTGDCALVGDRVVVVGEAWGPHDDQNVIDFQARSFVLEIDFSADLLTALVNSAEIAWHSGHVAVAPRGEDHYVTAGYRCLAKITPCLDTTATLSWFSVGAAEDHRQNETNARRFFDVSLSSAGYAVVAGQRIAPGQGFLVQAWPDAGLSPVLDYTSDKTKVQLANGVAVDSLGFIYAGGYFEEINDTLVAVVAKLHPY